MEWIFLANANSSHYSYGHAIHEAHSAVVLMTDQGVPIPVLQAGSKSAAGTPISTVKSLDLLGERGELKIEHNGEQYSLRRTRHGKLILTK